MSEEKAKAAAPAAGGKEGGEAAKAPAKKGLNKKYVVIGGILVADLAIMAGLGFFIVSKLKGEDPAVKAHQEEAEHEKKKKEMMTKIGKVLPKPLAFTVNIAGQGQGDGHYLKCAIQLEWDAVEGKGGEGEGATEGVGKEIEKRMPKITDIIINILSAQTYADLLKPSGKQKIKESIVTEINAILPVPEAKDKEHAGGDGKLRNAFFTEFLVQ